VDIEVKGKFHSRKMFSPIFLTFVTEETKVLLYLLIFALDFAISFRVIGSSEASFNIKMLIEGMHKSGCKLLAVIGEDLFWDFMKMEDVLIVKFYSTFGC
jgi:hypothetical protein